MNAIPSHPHEVTGGTHLDRDRRRGAGDRHLLHADYPIRRCWPQVSDAADDVGTTNDRQTALRGLTVLFLLQRDNPLKATCTVDSWHALDDGQVEVVATIDLGSKLGPPAVTIDPLLHHRRFVLEYTGWWSLGFRGHEPFHATF